SLLRVPERLTMSGRALGITGRKQRLGGDKAHLELVLGPKPAQNREDLSDDRRKAPVQCSGANIHEFLSHRIAKSLIEAPMGPIGEACRHEGAATQQGSEPCCDVGDAVTVGLTYREVELV